MRSIALVGDLTPENFTRELKSLLKKYACEMEIDCCHDARSINVEFEGIYTDDGEQLRPFITLELPTIVTADEQHCLLLKRDML